MPLLPSLGGTRATPCPLHSPVTVPEVRRLLVRFLWAATRPPPTAAAVAAWSRWRRRHQKIAQDCHRRRRLKRRRQKGEL